MISILAETASDDGQVLKRFFSKIYCVEPVLHCSSVCLHGSWLQHGKIMSHTKSSRHLSAHKYLALMRTIRFNASQHRFNRCWTHALWNWVFWLAENGFPNFEIICISGQAQVCLVVYSLDYHRVKIFIPHVFRNGVLCARWMRQKGSLLC